MIFRCCNKILSFVVVLAFAGSAMASTVCDKIVRSDLLNMCLGDELKVADKRLNSSYSKLMHKLSQDRKGALRSAQTSWIALRDNDCEFVASVAAGGEAYQSLYLSCQIEQTRSRVRLLQEWQKRAL